MFKVSFTCTDTALAGVIRALNGAVSLRVQHFGEDMGAATMPKPTKLVRRKRRAGHGKKGGMASARVKQAAALARRQDPSGNTIIEQAIRLVRSYGIPAFSLGEFQDSALRLGIKKQMAFKALACEIDSGNLRRVGPGLYQRTGQALTGFVQKAS